MSPRRGQSCHRNILNKRSKSPILLDPSIWKSICWQHNWYQGLNNVRIQNETSAKIKLSQLNEFYPGTNYRIVVFSGQIMEIVQALGLSVEKVMEEHCHSFIIGKKNIHLKMIVPSAAVGALIGREGETMKKIVKDTKCKVRISPKSSMIPFLNERIIHITGKPSKCMLTISFLLEKLNKSEEFAVYKSPAAGFFFMNRMAYADGYMPNLVGSTLYPDSANLAAAYANPYGYYAYDPTGVAYGTGYAPNPVFATNYKPNMDAVSPNEADPGSTQLQQQEESLIGNVAQDGSDTTSITMEISKQFAGHPRSKR